MQTSDTERINTGDWENSMLEDLAAYEAFLIDQEDPARRRSGDAADSQDASREGVADRLLGGR